MILVDQCSKGAQQVFIGETGYSLSILVFQHAQKVISFQVQIRITV